MTISDTTETFRIPMYGRLSAVSIDQIMPRQFSSYGIYTQDPLDSATFQWMGET